MQEVQEVFLTCGEEMSVIKSHLSNLSDIVYNRFGKTHKLYKRIYSLNRHIGIHLCSALDDRVCSFYPRYVHELEGISITRIFYRTTELTNPFLNTPSENKNNRSKRLNIDESKYLLDTLHLIEQAMRRIIKNKTLLFGRSQSLAAKTFRLVNQIICDG